MTNHHCLSVRRHKFKSRNFPKFSFQIPSESEEVSIEKVVHLFKILKSIFYFKFLELRKVKFGSITLSKNLNIFEPLKFETV
jgi:hypothetical protein